jgi:hypothetical protein
MVVGEHFRSPYWTYIGHDATTAAKTRCVYWFSAVPARAVVALSEPLRKRKKFERASAPALLTGIFSAWGRFLLARLLLLRSQRGNRFHSLLSIVTGDVPLTKELLDQRNQKLRLFGVRRRR